MKKILLKLGVLLAIATGLALGVSAAGMTFQQSLSIGIFSASILGTLFFWDFRLSFAFIGTTLLLLTKTIDLEHVIEFASLEVILFLVGMMVLIGLLKEEGMFAWIVSIILRARSLSARRFFLTISLFSAFLACAVDEVTSIVFMVAAILEICDYFEVNPVPFIISSVLVTNIGSAGTVLGNPIGILLASKSGLTFEDFLVHAFPLMLLCLGVTIALLMIWFRKPLHELNARIRAFGANEMLIHLISVPPERNLKISLGIFGLTLGGIALHHRTEVLLNLAPNTVLLAVPLFASGLVMIWKHQRARHYIERDVEWWTLLFFLLLFVQAGTLKYTGATRFIAERIIGVVGSQVDLLSSVVLWISAIGSSILDNVVLVAAFIPIVQGFQSMGYKVQALWWALLFGGCLGGNITLIGSTANIVALGILEKEKHLRISFLRWFGVGLFVGIVTTGIVWVVLVLVPWYN